MADEDKKTEQTETEQVEQKDPGYVTMDQLNTFMKSQLGPLQKSLDVLAANSKPVIQKEETEERLTLAVLKKQVQSLQDEKQAETKAKQELQLRSTVKDALTRNGVAGNMVKAAMAVLVDADKAVGFGETGEIVFKGQYGEQDLDTGLKDYFRSEEGKSFLPPKGAAGSNDKRYNGASAGGGKQTLSDEEIVAKLFG